MNRTVQNVSIDEFYKSIADWTWIPFTQDKHWLLSLVSADMLHFFLDARHGIACAGFIKKKHNLNMLCIYGECRRQEVTKYQDVADFWKQILECGYDIYEINLDSYYNPIDEIGLREAGFLRPIGMFSTTLSKIINLENITFDHNWRRNLKHVAQYNLSFEVVAQPNKEDIRQYVEMHNEMTKRKGFNDFLSFEQLSKLLSEDSHFLMCRIRTADNEIVASGIIYRRGKEAKFIYSTTTLAGRNLSASYALYQGIFTYLHQTDTELFDMGRLSPSTHIKNNLFTFKDGVRGDYVQYQGEWLWCRKKWMPIVLYFMKKYIWKRVQV